MPVSPPDASAFLTLGMLLLAVLVASALLVLVHRALAASGRPDGDRIVRRVGIAFVLWIAGSLAVASSGVLARTDLRPPPFAALLLTVLVGSIAFARSGLGREVARRAPLALLVGLQAFRLPLELLMYEAHREGVMPIQMSFAGRNYDVITGVVALLVAYLVHRGKASPALLRATNGLGIVLLVNVLVVAVASTPVFHAFGESPDRLNTWIFFPPFVLLPTVLVATAIVLHVLLFQRLGRNAAR